MFRMHTLVEFLKMSKKSSCEILSSVLIVKMLLSNKTCFCLDYILENTDMLAAHLQEIFGC